MWDSRQPPLSEKILEHKSTKMNTTPELLLFFTRSFLTQAEMELLWLLVFCGEKKMSSPTKKMSHIQAQKTFFESPFKAHLQALRGI